MLGVELHTFSVRLLATGKWRESTFNAALRYLILWLLIEAKYLKTGNYTHTW